MAEFKLAPELLTEIGEFLSSGTALNNEYTRLEEGTISTLPAGKLYLEQHEQIKALIDTYIALVQKDVKDLADMYETATGMDTKIAGAYQK